ncbi:MAG: sulfite exporter TauE/SafE family protein [Halioglobus sp.]
MILAAVGFAVGMALGLTGAGGSILAVPLLMLALDLGPQEAMGISLGAVSAAAMVGVVVRRRKQPPQINIALSLAATGVIAAPVGRWLAHQIDERVIIVMFSLLASFVAVKMWRGANCLSEPDTAPESTATAKKSSQHFVFLAAGVGLGLLSGLLGVGGGFVIVPFLVLYAGMRIEQAVSTSLLVIALVGMSGYSYHALTTEGMHAAALVMIGVGSVVGIFSGCALSARISAPTLQRTFSASVVFLMSYMLLGAFSS